MLMIKKKKYSGYTKSELIEELHIMIDNCNNLEWQIENQAKYISQNYIAVKWIKNWCGNEPYWSNLAMHLIEDWERENAKID